MSAERLTWRTVEGGGEYEALAEGGRIYVATVYARTDGTWGIADDSGAWTEGGEPLRFPTLRAARAHVEAEEGA